MVGLVLSCLTLWHLSFLCRDHDDVVAFGAVSCHADWLVLERLLVLETVEDAICGDTHNDFLDIDRFRTLELAQAFIAKSLATIFVGQLVFVTEQCGLIGILERIVIVGEAFD